MNPTVATNHKILGYNTWLFGNAVANVGADKTGYRVNNDTNQFDRLAGHLTVTRYNMAKMIGIGVPALGWGAFEKAEGPGAQFATDLECPQFDDITTKFNHVTEALMSKLPEVSDSTLSQASPIPIPGDNPTIGDLLTFLTMHETYHIGQMGLLKKSMSGKRIMDT